MECRIGDDDVHAICFFSFFLFFLTSAAKVTFINLCYFVLQVNYMSAQMLAGDVTAAQGWLSLIFLTIFFHSVGPQLRVTVSLGLMMQLSR